MINSGLRRRLARSATFALVAAGIVTLAARAGADTLVAKTVRIPNKGLAEWIFNGDQVIGIHGDLKSGQRVAWLNAFSLDDATHAWHVEQTIGDADINVFPGIFSDAANNQWYLGTGPLSRIDLATGAIKWTVPCTEIGFVQPAATRLLSGDRLLVIGSKKCKQKSDYDALKEPCISMIDANTGRILWRYETESLEYKLALGYWARVARLQGYHVSADKRIQLETMLASSNGDFDPPDPDRIMIAGARFEGVRLADGAPLYKTKDKPGIMRGAYDGRAFFREGDKVTAFNVADGAEAWTFDANSSARVYTIDDLRDMNNEAPEDMHDIIISGVETVSRVSTATGKASWSVKRGGMSWWTSKHAFLTASSDKVTAYDWATGAKKWEAKIESRPKALDAGAHIVFVDGDKWVGTEPQPPFRVSVTNGATGQIAWARKDLDGKKITGWDLLGAEHIRLYNEKGAVSLLNVADGSPAAAATASATTNRFLVTYAEKAKALQCHDNTGALVWERKGEPGLLEGSFLSGKDCIVWVTKDGTQEVINRADGASLWKMKGAKSPNVAVNADGTYMVAQNEDDLTIVKLAR